MKVYYSDKHRSHSPKTFISRGAVAQCPEIPERADILLGAVKIAGYKVESPGSFGVSPLQRVHGGDYLDFLEQAWARWQMLPTDAKEMIPNVHPGRNMMKRPEATIGLAGYYQADTACPISNGTWEAARSSADCALSAANYVLSGGDNSAYALCRPPGHHAFSDMAGGFCFLNNTAISAQYCLDSGADRVAIIDVDVHHGNGTQQIFYERSDVLTVSLHGDPNDYYPFYLGYSDEFGSGSGDGFNANFPLPEGTGDATYIEQLGNAIKKIERFRPDVMVVALGLDASEHDGHHPYFRITTEGFRQIGGLLAKIGLPTVFVQEGGYISDYLGENLTAVLTRFSESR